MSEQGLRQRIREINRLLNEADELGINAQGLEQELQDLSDFADPLQPIELPEGGETPSQEYRRIRNLRDLRPTFSFGDGEGEQGS